jgi:polysaccharide chain length determinant protein (PEP-CTERM system associated)
MDNFDLTKYIDMARRRKWWFIIPFLVTILGGLAFVLLAPKVYQAETLILVQPQSVPQDIVTPIVSTGVEDRLRTITQQVTSRTNLEGIIKHYALYSNSRDQLLMEQKVALLRKDITIEVNQTGRSRGSGTNAFTIRFEGKDPNKVMEVTNALASNFISENLSIRENQATGTSTFLANELTTMQQRLAEKEEALKKYREKYMGGLPEQLQTNLSILERLQGQLAQYGENLRDAENRKIAIQKQIADATKPPSSAGESGLPETVSGPDQLAALRNQLASLEARYTPNHPDIIRLKETIAKLEAQQNEEPAEASPRRVSPETRRMIQTLNRQLVDVELEIKGLKGEIVKTQNQIKWYQKKVEQTPEREQELLSLNRDYENIKGLYNSLLSKKLEAEIAVSMEKKQKGERFKVIDAAKLPQRPIKPDVRKLLLMTLVLALGLGGGLGYLVEMMDTSYKSPEEVEKELNLPILVSMPIRYTNKELRHMRIRRVAAYVSVSVGFVAAVFAIVVSAKGLDKTLEFVNGIISRM